MKKMIAFLFIFLFALVFVGSYMFGIAQHSYGRMVNLAGQAGLGLSIIVFLLLPGKKKPHGK